MTDTAFIESANELVEHDGKLFIRESLEIPDEFVDYCRKLRSAVMANPYGDHMVPQVMVPDAVWNHWIKIGFVDPKEQHPHPEAQKAMLRKMGMDDFIIDTRRY